MSPPRDQTGNDVPADPPPSSMRYLRARLASASAAARRLRDGAPDPLDTVENEVADVTDADQDFVEEGSLVAPGEGRRPAAAPRPRGTTGGTARATPAAPGPWSARSRRHPRCRLPRWPTARHRAPRAGSDADADADAATDATRSGRAADLRGPEGSVRSVEPDGSQEAARTEAAAEPTSRWRSYRGGFSWGPGPKAAAAAAGAERRRPAPKRRLGRTTARAARRPRPAEERRGSPRRRDDGRPPGPGTGRGGPGRGVRGRRHRRLRSRRRARHRPGTGAGPALRAGAGRRHAAVAATERAARPPLPAPPRRGALRPPGLPPQSTEAAPRLSQARLHRADAGEAEAPPPDPAPHGDRHQPHDPGARGRGRLRRGRPLRVLRLPPDAERDPGRRLRRRLREAVLGRPRPAPGRARPGHPERQRRPRAAPGVAGRRQRARSTCRPRSAAGSGRCAPSTARASR